MPPRAKGHSRVRLPTGGICRQTRKLRREARFKTGDTGDRHSLPWHTLEALIGRFTEHVVMFRASISTFQLSRWGSDSRPFHQHQLLERGAGLGQSVSGPGSPVVDFRYSAGLATFTGGAKSFTGFMYVEMGTGSIIPLPTGTSVPEPSLFSCWRRSWCGWVAV